MNNLIAIDKSTDILSDLTYREKVDILQEKLSELPQVEVLTNHYFANGMYCREVFSEAGTAIVGRVHKHEHFYIICSGTVLVAMDGYTEEITGPRIIVSKPGTKRAVICLTDCTRLTVHQVKSEDLDEIEKDILEPDEKSMFDINNKLKITQIKECKHDLLSNGS